MSWLEIQVGTAQLSLRKSGNFIWNTALQLQMGGPAWVEVMHDSAAGTVGIRAVNAPHGFPVVSDAVNDQYKIGSGTAITAAGISVDPALTAEPATWVQTTAPGSGPSEWFGHQPIYYLTLPT